MNALVPPRHKLILLGAAFAALLIGAAVSSGSIVSASRLALGLVGVAGLVWWFSRQQRTKTGFQITERMTVVQRVGLSPNTGAALIDIDGHSYLVVHGNGFAKVQVARRRRTSVVSRGES